MTIRFISRRQATACSALKLPVPITREQLFRGNGLAGGALAFQNSVEVVLRTVILPTPGCADPPGALAFRYPVGNLTST